MNRKKQVDALQAEIEITLKKWQAISEDLDIGYMGSVTLESTEDQGVHFMQSIYGASKIVVSNMLATIERVPKRMKKDYLMSVFEALMEIDEQVEQQFSN